MYCVVNGEFDSKIDEYIRKFGGAGRFVCKIIDSIDCPFAIVNVDSFEIEVTNHKDYFSGMKCWDLFKCVRENVPSGKCPVRMVVEGKKAIVVENCSSDDPLEIHAHPIFGEGGVVGVIMYGLDVVQSRALKESEEKFKAFFEASPRGMLMYQFMNDKLVLIDANPAVDEILGIDSKKLIGKTAEEAFPALVGTDVLRVFYDIVSKGGSHYIPEVFYDDGTVSGFYEQIIFRVSPGIFLVSFTDITERKKIEEKLRAEDKVHVKDIEERFYNILQNSQDLVYRYDFRTNGFDYVSESVFTILGYSLGEFMKMNRDDYNERIHPEDVEIVGYTGESSEEESVSNVEYRFKKKDGDYVWLNVNRVFFRDKNGGLIYSIEDVKDVTLRKAAEEDKIKLEERIEYMKNRSLKAKERVSLTEREKLVLWGFCSYPLLNDEELSTKLDLKRSTLTAIKNRLKGKEWFVLSYIPNFRKLGCQFFSIFDVTFRGGRAKGLDFIKNVPNIVLNNCQDNKMLGVFVSDKYVDFRKFLEEFAGVDALKYDFNEDSFFYDLDSVELYGFSSLINSLFGLNRKEKSVVYKFDNGAAELNVNEKRVLHAIVRDPEMSSADIAKKIWTSKPTVIKVKKKLLEEGYVYPCAVPDLRKIGFPYIARLSFSFDSDLSVVNGKESKDARVVLQVSGKKKMMKIMLFESEEEYEDEVDLIKETYRKKGIDFSSNSEIFSIQKRRVSNSKMESFISDALFGDEI